MGHYLARHKKKKLKVARTRDLALLLLIAEQQGFFSDLGVRVEYVEVPYARKGMELLVEGKVDMAVMAEIVFAYMGFYQTKEPIKTIASVEKRNADNILVRGENITPQEFKGKRIGFTPRTTSHGFLTLFLKKHGLSKKDVILKPLSPQAMPNALIRGDIDAMSLWQPHINNTLISMDELGLPYTHFQNSGFYTSEVTLAATRSLLVKNKHMVSNFLKGLQEAERYFKANPDQAHKSLITKMRVAKDALHVFDAFTPQLSPISPAYLQNIDMLADMILETDSEFQDCEKPNYMEFIDNSIVVDIIK